MAAATPASLASQEYLDASAPLVIMDVGTSAVTFAYKKHCAPAGDSTSIAFANAYASHPSDASAESTHALRHANSVSATKPLCCGCM